MPISERYTQGTVLRRVFALVLVCATLSTPLALAVCHTECADAAARRAAAPHHSCHDAGESAALAMTAVPHMCGHTDEAPAGVERAPHTVAAPAAVMSPWVWTPPSIVERVIAVDIQYSPPGSFQLVSQLRV
jgi:hypothetical protein